MSLPDTDTHLATLANGVRVVTLRLPHLASASVSVFVLSGSAHEDAAHSGISHVVEHMVFKGTRQRDCRGINLDAERLGAEVNAHTDKDHTAYHMRGLAAHAPQFVQMLGELVAQPVFPPDELERERQVLLLEHDEDDEDPLSTAYKLFDQGCFGSHAAARPVIGARRNIERFGRDDLVGWVGRHYTGTNIVVAAAGPLDPEAIVRAAEAVFGALPAGEPVPLAPPAWVGGLKTKSLPGCSQTHLVLGGAIPALAHEDPAAALAAAVLGEGMSSPLLDRIREQRGLVYHAAALAEVTAAAGQFVVEATTSPKQLDDCLAEVLQLLRTQAERIDAVDLERARNQLLVRELKTEERPYRRLEEMALDLCALGRIRPRAERNERLLAVGADAVREVFARLLQPGLSVAVAGSVGRGAGARVKDLLQRHARV